MAHPYHHALSSAEAFSAPWESHYPLHAYLDHSKEILADARHRGLLHHQTGALLITEFFPQIPQAREIAELHIKEDMGKIPSLQEWFPQLPEEFERRVRFKSVFQKDSLNDFLWGNPFDGFSQDGLEEILHILRAPERAEPQLKDTVHRAFYFSAVGPFLCEKKMGAIIAGSKTPTRYAAEWIIKNALGYIPSFPDLIQTTPIQDWMFQKAKTVGIPSEIP